MNIVLFEKHRSLINCLIRYGKYQELERLLERILPNGATIHIPDYYIGEIYLESTRILICPLTLNTFARRLADYSQLRALSYIVDPLSLQADNGNTLTRQKVISISDTIEFQSISDFPMSRVTDMYANSGKLLIMGTIDNFEKYKSTTFKALEMSGKYDCNYTPNSLIEIDSESGVTKKWEFGPNTYPVSIASTDQHTVAICTDGHIYGWGYNLNGALGDTPLPYLESPTRLRGMSRISPPMQYDEKLHSIVQDSCSPNVDLLYHNYRSGNDQYKGKIPYNHSTQLSNAEKESKIELQQLNIWNSWNWGKVSCCDYYTVFTTGDSTIHVWGTNRGQMLGTVTLDTKVDAAILIVDSAEIYDIACCDNAMVLNTKDGVSVLANDTSTKLADTPCRAVSANGSYFAISSGKSVTCYSTYPAESLTFIQRFYIPSEVTIDDGTLNIRITRHQSVIITTREYYAEYSFVTSETPLWKPLAGLEICAMDYDDTKESIVAIAPMRAKRDFLETHKDPVLTQFSTIPDNELYTTFLVFARCSSLRDMYHLNKDLKVIESPNGNCLTVKRHSNGGVKFVNVDNKVLFLFSALLRYNNLVIRLLIEVSYEQFKVVNKFCPACGGGEHCQCSCVSYIEQISDLSEVNMNMLRGMVGLIDRDTREGLFEAMKSGIGCDVELQPGIQGHKKLLQACSKLFRIAGNGFLVASERGINRETLLHVLEYVYTGDFKQIRASNIEDRVELYLQAMMVADMLYLLDDRFMEEMLALMDFGTVIPMMNMLNYIPERYRTFLLPKFSTIIRYHLQYFMRELDQLDESLYQEFKKSSYERQLVPPTPIEEERVCRQLGELFGPKKSENKAFFLDSCDAFDTLDNFDTLNPIYAEV